MLAAQKGIPDAPKAPPVKAYSTRLGRVGNADGGMAPVGVSSCSSTSLVLAVLADIATFLSVCARVHEQSKKRMQLAYQKALEMD